MQINPLSSRARANARVEGPLHLQPITPVRRHFNPHFRTRGWSMPHRPSSKPSPPAKTMPPSGSTRQAAPALRRAACTCSTTWWSPPSCSPRAFSASPRADRCFSVAKLFFAYGLGNALYFPLAVGATSILWPGPPHAATCIRHHRASPADAVLLGADQLRHAAGAHASRRPRLRSLQIRLGVSAGEALPAALFERFKRRFGVEILDGIGSTETLHMFISNRPGSPAPAPAARSFPATRRPHR